MFSMIGNLSVGWMDKIPEISLEEARRNLRLMDTGRGTNGMLSKHRKPYEVPMISMLAKNRQDK